jgi:hypothetical protein
MLFIKSVVGSIWHFRSWTLHTHTRVYFLLLQRRIFSSFPWSIYILYRRPWVFVSKTWSTFIIDGAVQYL